MSQALDIARAIDEAITNKLTNFCWWTDIHYGKNNVWWAKITLAIIFPTLSVILAFFYKKMRKIYSL